MGPYQCRGLFEFSEIQIQQNMDNLQHDDGETQVKKPGVECLPHNKTNHIRFLFSRKYLRKLDLSFCYLGDEDMSSAIWELPNLQELDLSGNKFSRLNFSLMRLPRLKLLNIKGCFDLVVLSELLSSIAVLKAHYCISLETLGNLSNCKWLWKVSLRGMNRVDGHILLDSMLKRNAIDDHLVSVTLEHHIPKWFVGRLFRRNTFTLRLPHDWYNDFCGFLIHVVMYNENPKIDIIMKQEVVEDPLSEIWQEYWYKTSEPENGKSLKTYVGYVSFSLLTRIACLNSTYNVISLSLRHKWLYYGAMNMLRASLVPRKSKDHPLQTTKVVTDCSEFWDEDVCDRKTFTIKHDSKSFIKILWQP